MALPIPVDEGRNKLTLQEALAPYFRLYPEVSGTSFIIPGRPKLVKADYLAIARPHVVMAGFTPRPFAIEVKRHNLNDHNKRTVIRMLAQAITYRCAIYDLNGQKVEPAFAAIYPPIAYYAKHPDNQADAIKDYEHQALYVHGFMRGFLHAAKRLAGQFLVGEIEIGEDGASILLSDEVYWTTRWGNRPTGFVTRTPFSFELKVGNR